MTLEQWEFLSASLGLIISLYVLFQGAKRRARLKESVGYENIVLQVYLEHFPNNEPDFPTLEEALNHVVRDNCWTCMAWFRHFKSQIVESKKSAPTKGSILGL